VFVRPPDDGGRGSRIRVSNAIVRRRDKTKCLPTRLTVRLCNGLQRQDKVPANKPSSLTYQDKVFANKTKCLPTKPYLLVCVLLDHAVFRRNLIDRADKLSQLVRERVGERVCGERGAGWGGLVMLPIIGWHTGNSRVKV
jgi:hypothetical protein